MEFRHLVVGGQSPPREASCYTHLTPPVQVYDAVRRNPLLVRLTRHTLDSAGLLVPWLSDCALRWHKMSLLG
jgi:hypothetical protein